MKVVVIGGSDAGIAAALRVRELPQIVGHRSYGVPKRIDTAAAALHAGWPSTSSTTSICPTRRRSAAPGTHYSRPPSSGGCVPASAAELLQEVGDGFLHKVGRVPHVMSEYADGSWDKY
jgi:hypothetical protein